MESWADVARSWADVGELTVFSCTTLKRASRSIFIFSAHNSASLSLLTWSCSPSSAVSDGSSSCRINRRTTLDSSDDAATTEDYCCRTTQVIGTVSIY